MAYDRRPRDRDRDRDREREEARIEADKAAAKPAEDLPPPPSTGEFWGTGRRKTSIARVKLTPAGGGKGKVLINKRDIDKYFPLPEHRNAVRDPMIATSTDGAFNVHINVHGGGSTGQAGAIRMGMARALSLAESRYEPTLRDRGYLTRDARIVERKKYGRRKARRRFQFSKR